MLSIEGCELTLKPEPLSVIIKISFCFSMFDLSIEEYTVINKGFCVSPKTCLIEFSTSGCKINLGTSIDLVSLLISIWNLSKSSNLRVSRLRYFSMKENYEIEIEKN